MEGHQIRKILLEVVGEFSRKGPGYLQTGPVLSEASRRLNLRGGDLETEQALLTFWNDLFRSGHLAWGYDLANAEPPSCHVTSRGRVALQNISRDPANPDGYLYYLSQRGSLNDVSASYLKEALQTYNSNCFKATAVMVGAAAESIVLELRDALATKVASLGRPLSKEFQDWRVKTVLDSLKRELDAQKNKMPKELAASYENYWPPFTQQIRSLRNDAGHPTSVDPVTPEDVHSSLLIFPALAGLAYDLKSWIVSSYT